ncbi:hypothetical protein [Aureimonas sp. ME7]|uniref:hypothetical protein n=1 Tax=Aureimonas sp. ME7 TaxID=2744252 RepID=UPI0015F594C8|nr:hypothetical protein [Aureimonas sp. ME7]
MTRSGYAVCLALAALTVLSGCGRKAVPVATLPGGQVSRAVVPDQAGTARLPKIAPLATDRSVLPTEVTTNPSAEKKRFVLDGLLN